jgi:DNA-binding NtrC family response regulator
MRILYVEDDARDADLTFRRLRQTAPHLQLETVSTIRDALSRLGNLAAEPLDLVLTDMHLPDGDGLSLLTHIRESGLPLAVVLITGAGDEETAVAALKARADDYVMKRKDYLAGLPTTLESALNHYRASTARHAHPLNVLYACDQGADIENTRRHLAVHANNIHLRVVSTGFAALAALHSNDNRLRYDVLLMDLQMPELNALEVLRELSHRNDQGVPVVLLCKQGQDELARQGLTLGASSYLAKSPGYLYQLAGELEEAHSRTDFERREAALNASKTALRKALAEVQELKDRLPEEDLDLNEDVRAASKFPEIIGQSEALNRVLHQAEQVAPLNTTVLILGETGTGKELLAQAIHDRSLRHNHPLVKVNCAALPGPLIESELFGHDKGAFTGADTKRIGRFEIANRGSILLDEVGELPLDLQAKLLRVLEEGELEHVGSSHTIKVDVRVMAATNRNLAEAVKAGTFRSDLYYRLSIFPITLPPLRERQEDIPLLVTYLVKQLSTKLGKKIETIPHSTMTALKNYSWPGNVRELRNVIERAVIITPGSKLLLFEGLEAQSLQADAPGSDRQFDAQPPSESDIESLEQSEYKLILRTLRKVHWKVEGPGGAAQLLKVKPSTLRSRMTKLGISRPKI